MVDNVEVGRIVELAQRNNLARGITGMLLFSSGGVFQWIEGPATQMTPPIVSLHSDDRHHDIVSLSQGEQERERLYPNGDRDKVEADGIREVLQDALESAEDEKNVTALQRIIGHFASG